MMEKVGGAHLERKAVVYLRQSSLRQVRENRESTARQYALRDRALRLGWPADNVEVVDEDLGQSGASTQGRSGFQKLAEEVAQGKVGALFALEVSRLARSSADWHRLLELAGLADVVIGDEEALYNPKDYNDRLLLGLKGQFADAELYWMRLRLDGGRLSKARRGELVFPAPTGYVWSADGHLLMDPNEEVRRTVALVFERFDVDGSGRKVVRYFTKHGLQMPMRDAATGELRWTPPRHHWVLHLLRNPIFAGVYAFGRNESRKVLVDGQIRQRGQRMLPIDRWKVCIRDHHPAYLTWEKYVANQEKLRGNNSRGWRHTVDRRGAAREGASLLQGLVLCGRCGQRMYTYYHRHGSDITASYACTASEIKEGAARCWSTSAAPIDDAVTTLLFKVLQPADIDLSLAVVRDAERQDAQIERQWHLRLERAHYDARLAERRYKAVDPENRTVTRTLEREWNEKLEALASAERDFQAARSRELVELSDETRARIRALAKDVPSVWSAPSTTQEERKNIVRMLVEAVTLSPIDVPRRLTRVQVLWVTGAVTELQVPRPAFGPVEIPADTLALIKALTFEGRPDSEIADELNRRNVPCPTARLGTPDWTEARLRLIRYRRGLPRKRNRRGNKAPVLQREDGLYSSRGVANLLGISIGMVDEWIAQGHITPTIRARQAASWFHLSDTDVARLSKLRDQRAAQGYGRGGRRHASPIDKEEQYE